MPGWSKRAREAVCAVLAIAAVLPALAQEAFRSRVDLVQVTVSVTDANGRLVTGLTIEDFQLFEDGDEQRITQLTAERVPASVGVLLDASDSMRGQPVVDARDALDRFVGELLPPGDEVFVATFSHLPRLAAHWTQPPVALRNVLRDLQPAGGTAIYDAVAETARLFDNRHHTRAALIVISDGGDTASDRTLHQALDIVRRTDAFVYAVGIDSPEGRVGSRVNPEALREISSLSGGYPEIVRNASELGPATARIADELNKQYSIGYSSTRPPDGTWRGIRVRVRDHVARARRGYYADPPRR